MSEINSDLPGYPGVPVGGYNEVIAPGAFGDQPVTVPLRFGQNGPVIGTATVSPDGQMTADVWTPAEPPSGHRRFPRDPSERTPEDWSMIDLGGLGLRLLATGFAVGGAAGFLLGWLVTR